MTITQIRDMDDRLKQIVADIHLQIPDVLNGEPLKITACVLSSLIDSLVSIKAGILDLAEKENLYGASVLFRVFLEHILKTIAIFLKAIDEKSDAFAEEYYRLGIKEAFDYIRACEKAGLPIVGNPKSVLNQWIPEANNMSRNQILQLEEPFKYRKLISTIRDIMNADSTDFLSKIIPNYSELSGFVHGGPTAKAKLDQISATGLRASELNHMADLSVSMLYSAYRWLLMLALPFDQSFNKSMIASTKH